MKQISADVQRHPVNKIEMILTLNRLEPLNFIEISFLYCIWSCELPVVGIPADFLAIHSHFGELRSPLLISFVLLESIQASYSSFLMAQVVFLEGHSKNP